MKSRKQTASTVEVPAPTPEAPPSEPTRLELLEAFLELVGERWGYWMGRRLTQQDMSDKCKDEIKAARDKAKVVSEAIEGYIGEPTDDLREKILSGRADLEKLRKVAAEKMKPFRDKIAPIAQAQRYCDNVAIPDSLKELGSPVAPRFSLSKWIGPALEASKRKKK